MDLLTVTPQALLIQDANDFLTILRKAVRGIADEISDQGLTEEQVVEWIVKETVERVYYLLSTRHDSRDWKYRRLYDRVRNMIDLDHLTGLYIKVPQLYGEHCYIDLDVRGIDLYLWYFKQTHWASNYSYERKWN
ncbi:hypothetical protein [Burkholderia phage FLC9]|nr:hypothetical protein [Burkholderia phage FLC9]